MVSFESENELLQTVAALDSLVARCLAGELPFEEFVGAYADFYMSYALDGHESDDQERALLKKHAGLIEPHQRVSEVLGRLCSDADAGLDSYKQAGRIGSGEALALIRMIVTGVTQ